MSDSKELWLGIRKSLKNFNVTLGVATGQSYIHDPKHLVFHASRYKFVAKMLEGAKTVLEIGCADAFGAPLVAQSVGRLICTDIDDELISDNRIRLEDFKNIEFVYHDFRKSEFTETYDAVYLVDVLEHIYLEEEHMLLSNAFKSLSDHGIAIIGTPNIYAEQFASEHSKTGHINLKSHETLKALCQKYFNNIFLFSMNDEVLHTGYHPMSHYIWAICTYPKK